MLYDEVDEDEDDGFVVEEGDILNGEEVCCGDERRGMIRIIIALHVRPFMFVTICNGS